MDPEREEEKIGIVMLTFLSQGELTQVQKIAAKERPTEKEFLFVMQLAGRSTRIPLEPRPPGIEVLIRQESDQFSIVRVKRNVHLQN
jgi:hypothetical protein